MHTSGMYLDRLFSLQAEQNFIELPHDSLDLSDDHLYVFRVATVNVNGTQGFSLTSRKCRFLSD